MYYQVGAPTFQESRWVQVNVAWVSLTIAVLSSANLAKLPRKRLALQRWKHFLPLRQRKCKLFYLLRTWREWWETKDYIKTPQRHQNSPVTSNQQFVTEFTIVDSLLSSTRLRPNDTVNTIPHWCTLVVSLHFQIAYLLKNYQQFVTNYIIASVVF